MRTKNYYTEDDISFYPCSEAIELCSECESKEKCTQCIEDFAAVDDGKKCVAEIPFCLVYNKVEKFKKCSRCIDGYNFLSYRDRTQFLK